MVVRGLAVVGMLSCGALACVHIPDSLRADFREVGPGERSNFRPGVHGTARGRDLVGPMPTLTADAGAASEAGRGAGAAAPPLSTVEALRPAEPAGPAEPDAALTEGGVQ